MMNFYLNFDSFIGLSLKNDNNTHKATNIMDVLLDCVLCLLNTKMVLSDDILLICYEYCNTMINNNNNKLMLKIFRWIISMCL